MKPFVRQPKIACPKHLALTGQAKWKAAKKAIGALVLSGTHKVQERVFRCSFTLGASSSIRAWKIQHWFFLLTGTTSTISFSASSSVATKSLGKHQFKRSQLSICANF